MRGCQRGCGGEAACLASLRSCYAACIQNNQHGILALALIRGPRPALPTITGRQLGARLPSADPRNPLLHPSSLCFLLLGVGTSNGYRTPVEDV